MNEMLKGNRVLPKLNIFKRLSRFLLKPINKIWGNLFQGRRCPDINVKNCVEAEAPETEFRRKHRSGSNCSPVDCKNPIMGITLRHKPIEKVL